MDQTGLRRRIENYRPFGAQEERERQTMLSYMDRFSDLPERSNETAHFTEREKGPHAAGVSQSL